VELVAIGGDGKKPRPRRIERKPDQAHDSKAS
jgi:hypothetical protein